MSSPAFSYPDREVYFRNQQNRVLNKHIREDEIYTAFSLLTPTFSDHHTVAFPVKFETATRPLGIAPMATIAMRMVLLNEDLRPVPGAPTPGVIENGVWELDRPIQIEKSTRPVKQGYLLYSLPGEIDPDHLYNTGRQDPRSIY